MSLITLSEAKAHCRITTSSEDSLVAVYLDAALDYCASYCDRAFPSVLPGSVKAAALLMVGELYASREVTMPGSMSVNPTILNLLQPYRRYGFGQADTVAAPSGLDAEGFIAGDSWSRQWIWRGEDGVAINITGYSGVIEFLSGDSVVLTQALTIASAVGGTFAAALTAAQTATHEDGNAWYRVRVTSGAGIVTTLDRKLVVVQ